MLADNYARILRARSLFSWEYIIAVRAKKIFVGAGKIILLLIGPEAILIKIKSKQLSEGSFLNHFSECADNEQILE